MTLPRFFSGVRTSDFKIHLSDDTLQTLRVLRRTGLFRDERAYYVYTIADHQQVYAELGVQATAYQTGIPPVVAAELLAEGVWRDAGVLAPEQCDPDPFLERLPAAGMPWQVREVAQPRLGASAPGHGRAGVASGVT